MLKVVYYVRTNNSTKCVLRRKSLLKAANYMRINKSTKCVLRRKSLLKVAYYMRIYKSTIMQHYSLQGISVLQCHAS